MRTVWRSILIFLLSAVPLSESKGAIVVARLWHLPFRLSAPLCLAGSFLPVLFLLWWNGNGHLHLPKKLSTVPPSLQKYIDKYGCWALLVTIAIPFTGMGCWLGAFLARAGKMEKKRAALCIFLGDLISVILLTGCVHGVITGLEHLLGLV